MKRRKILIYTGKVPGNGCDIDGGSVLMTQLIDTFKYHNDLTLVINRATADIYNDIFVKKIRYLHRITISNNKFENRLANSSINKLAFTDYQEYDIIIVVHISFLFGLEEFNETFWNKVFLFPMFCTPAYCRSGEFVPQFYTDKERTVLNKVHHIISPSTSEKNELIEYYGVESSKIDIIYRGISPFFYPSNAPKNLSKLQIVYIASIKKQKNNILAIELLELLRKKGIDANINLVCTVQDEDVLKNLYSFIEERELVSYVSFYFGISQRELSDKLRQMDINISVSRHETFGRGIYEGITSGLPTFVFNSLECVHELCDGVIGVSFSNDIQEMATEIQNVIMNSHEYMLRASSLKKIADEVSYYREQSCLKHTILGDVYGALEYLGVNLDVGGEILEEKKYFYYNKQYYFEFPYEIQSHLAPFDVGIRNENWSISYFIKNADRDLLAKIEKYFREYHGIVTGVPDFVDLFSKISNLGTDTHYEPVLSIKTTNNIVNSVSYYVTTVTNKTLCESFWKDVCSNIVIEENTKNCIELLMYSQGVTMFQLSWDFVKGKGLAQNKIYLKIKHIHDFIDIISKIYPILLENINRENLRLCEISFVIQNSKLHHFNLYFKPL